MTLQMSPAEDPPSLIWASVDGPSSILRSCRPSAKPTLLRS